jgi:hypothetical protein
MLCVCFIFYGVWKNNSQEQGAQRKLQWSLIEVVSETLARQLFLYPLDTNSFTVVSDGVDTNTKALLYKCLADNNEWMSDFSYNVQK